MLASVTDSSQINSSKNLILDVSPSQNGYSSVSSSEGEAYIEMIQPKAKKHSFKKL